MSLHKINIDNCSFCGREAPPEEAFWCISNIKQFEITANKINTVRNVTKSGGSVPIETDLTLYVRSKVNNNGSTFDKFCKQCYKILSDFVQENRL